MKVAFDNHNGVSNIYVKGKPELKEIENLLPIDTKFTLVLFKDDIYYVKLNNNQEVDFNPNIKFYEID